MGWITSLCAAAAWAGLCGQEVEAVRLEEIAGSWRGAASHAGTSSPVLLALQLHPDGTIEVRASLPAMHAWMVSMGRATPRIEGSEVVVGPFAMHYDRAEGSLSGNLPASLVPVHTIPFVLQRVPSHEPPARPRIDATVVEPVWTYDAGAPLWPGVTYAGGAVYAGDDEGILHALAARDGEPLWDHGTDAPLRSRPTVHEGVVYQQSDDGGLYALDAADGSLRWRVAVAERPAERLPFDDPRSRYDRYSSGVSVADGRLYLGTHEGKLLALALESGAKLWEFPCGEALLAAPCVQAGRVYAGCYDGCVYALDAAGGKLLWKRDTRAPVVSTPALYEDVLVIGSRSYDLYGLAAASGEPRWSHYLWFSWVESSATLRDGIAYVGSSDAALLLALDARTGEERWASDVWGWAWGQPAVGAERVYIGTSAQVGYPTEQSAAALALERQSGRIVWRMPVSAPPSGPFGFTGSPDIGQGLVYFSGLDGKVYALRE